jgi:hypothetical protein
LERNIAHFLPRTNAPAAQLAIKKSNHKDQTPILNKSASSAGNLHWFTNTLNSQNFYLQMKTFHRSFGWSVAFEKGRSNVRNLGFCAF